MKRGAPGEDGVDIIGQLQKSPAEVELHAVQGAADLAEAPLVYLKFSQRFAAAKESSNKDEATKIGKELTSFLDGAQKTQKSIEMIMTTLDKNGIDYLEYDRLIKIFKEAVEFLFDLEEVVGTWLESN